MKVKPEASHLMEFLFLFVRVVGFLTFGLLSAHDQALETNVDAIKKKWMDFADAQVEIERIKLLDSYGLKLDDFIQFSERKDVRQMFAGNLDAAIEKELSIEKKSSWFDRLKNYFFGKPEVRYEKIHTIASKIFKNFKPDCICIIDDQQLEGNVGVCVHRDKRTCYLTLNTAFYDCEYRLQILEDVLSHEYCHIAYDDNLEHELIQCLCWTNSHDGREVVVEKSYPVHRAYESRADIYALIHAYDNGDNYIQFLRSCAQSQDALTHPKPADRIKLLEQIQAELNECILMNR